MCHGSVTRRASRVVRLLLQYEWPNVDDEPDVRETHIVYTFDYLPAGLFNRAQVRLYQFSDSSKMWKHGSILTKNNHMALVQQTG